MRSEAGELETFYASEIESGKLAGDGDHPHAGKYLKVRVKILELPEATQDGQLLPAPASPPPMHRLFPRAFPAWRAAERGLCPLPRSWAEGWSFQSGPTAGYTELIRNR